VCVCVCVCVGFGIYKNTIISIIMLGPECEKRISISMLIIEKGISISMLLSKTFLYSRARECGERERERERELVFGVSKNVH
jgi:hypothetical protein